MKKIKAALLGFGNVGAGTYEMLEMNRRHIEETLDLDIEFKKILVRDKSKARAVEAPAEIFTENIEDITADPEIGIVAEALGGIEPAASYMLAAMKAGKSVVTANKAALAAKWEELNSAAAENSVKLRFEASVAGGIPIINALQNALAGNIYEELMGIVNGTTNYILTQMSEGGKSYEKALKDAQRLGFAEADPTADVEGIDAANKLSILIALTTGIYVRPEDIPREGITKVSKEDIAEAEKDGKTIKLIAKLGLAEGLSRKPQSAEDMVYSVKPELLPKSHPLATVSNEFNAVFVRGNAVGDVMFYGRGAGPLPTGSAVLNDIIQIAKCEA